MGMNQIARLAQPYMTTEEFLAWPGDTTGRKFELVDGEVQAMSPANRIHGTIQANLAWLLVDMVRVVPTPLQVVTEGAIIPGMDAHDNVRVPDLVVGPDNAERGDQVITAPVLIVEILSPGNRRHTRDNVRAYATLPSVREIVVVHTDQVLTEIYRRDAAGNWPANPQKTMPGQAFQLHTIGLDCLLEDVYARTWLLRSPG